MNQTLCYIIETVIFHVKEKIIRNYPLPRTFERITFQQNNKCVQTGEEYFTHNDCLFYGHCRRSFWSDHALEVVVLRTVSCEISNAY